MKIHTVIYTSVQSSSVQLLSHVPLFVTPWITVLQVSLSITNSWSSLKLTSIESVMPSSHLILCRPLFLLPPIPPSIRVFSNELSRVQHFATHGLHHARIPCPSLSPRVCSNSYPLSQWCHPTISSSVVPFSSCLQSFPASGCFPMSQFFTSGGQSTGASASASVLPTNIQGWFPSGLTGWISLLFDGLSRVFSSTTIWEHQKYLTKVLNC